MRPFIGHFYLILHTPTGRAYHPKATGCPYRTVETCQARLYETEAGVRRARAALHQADQYDIRVTLHGGPGTPAHGPLQS